MNFTVDYINENIDIWEELKIDHQSATPDNIPPQPSPDVSSTRPRSGI